MRCLPSSAVIGFGCLLGFKPASLPLAIRGALSHQIDAGVAQTSPSFLWVSLNLFRSQWAPEMKDVTGCLCEQTILTSHIHKIRPGPCLFITPHKYQRLGATHTETRVPVCAATKCSLKSICASFVGLCAKFKQCLLARKNKTKRDIVSLLPATGIDVTSHCDAQLISCMTCNAIFCD